jgi:hypothetical protein
MGNIYKKKFPLTLESGICWDSGYSAEELGAWFDVARAAMSCPGKPARMIVFDRRRFEKHQSAQAQTLSDLTFKNSGASPEFVKMNRELHCIKGAVQGMPVSYRSVDPTMISGGNDTAWRNLLVNMASVVGVLGEPGPLNYFGVIKGDDGLLVLHHSVEISWGTFESESAAYGLPVTGLITTDLADVEFCSNIPYPTMDGTVFGPKIGRTLQRFGWSLSNAPSDVYGAATSLLETTNHIPFLRQFIDAHRRLSVTDGEPKRYFKYKTLAREMHQASPATYAFISERYGLSASLEVHFEELLSTVQCLPASIDWPLIDQLVARDE